jgi:hypothetical protein
MNIKNIKKSKKGIALLFAVMLSMIFLTIAVGVLNIAVKELNFSTSGKNTNDAFFAADTGVECALYNDKTASEIFTKENFVSEINCFNSTPYTLEYSNGGTVLDSSFNVPDIGFNGNSCAKVVVSKTFSDSDMKTVISTKIISKGYNTAQNVDCSSDLTNRVERVLEVNY